MIVCWQLIVLPPSGQKCQKKKYIAASIPESHYFCPWLNQMKTKMSWIVNPLSVFQEKCDAKWPLCSVSIEKKKKKKKKASGLAVGK